MSYFFLLKCAKKKESDAIKFRMKIRVANFRGPRGILARTSRIRGAIESIPRGIEE